MALTKFTTDVENIQALSNKPNEIEGLTADQLKKKFDDASIDLKAYLNETLTDELDTKIAEIESDVDDLGYATSYIVATAVTDADYKINITNTLATNLILNISFPAATTAASNARLSIDDGITYKDIIWGTTSDANVIGTYIQNKKVSLVYNGTDWIQLDLDSGWQTITPTTGSAGTGSYIPQYKRVGNVVYFKGLISGVSQGDDLVTLPNGFYPIGVRLDISNTNDSLVLYKFRIYETGLVELHRTESATQTVFLAAISYPVD